MAKKQKTQIFDLGEIRERMEKMSKDIEQSVGDLGKKAADALPEGSRKQVDQVIDRLSDVRGDVNKRVDAVRSDLEKQVTSIRKQTEKRSRKLTSVVQKQARKYAEDLFKSLRLPVRKDLDAIKRRLTSIERRIDELAKARKAA
ncbi:MAG: hypothetical protein VCA74_02770 [Deltaproteobacteria bacterium]